MKPTCSVLFAKADMPVQRYRDDITGLRAVAVLAVIANHFSHRLLPGGNLGVDVFFVISGFVITRSITSRAEGQGLAGFLGRFYERRFVRLGPALVVCVAVSSVFQALFNAWPKEGLTTGVTALFGLSNFYLYYKSSDYFAESTQLNPFTHTWSLGVEEQFYLVYPVIAFCLLAGASRSRERLFAPAVGALMAASLIGCAVLQMRDPIAAFYLSPFRFWELALGCLCARLPDDFAAESRWRPIVLALALIFLLVTLIAPYSANVLQMAAAAAATAVLITFGGGGSFVDRLLLLAPAQYFGRISYSLYLWHWPVLAIARQTIGVSWLLAPFELALMLLLADLSYRKVERRWTGRSLSIGPIRKFIAYISIPGTLAASLLVLIYPLNGVAFVGHRAKLAGRGAASMDKPYVAPLGGEWKGAPCLLKNNLDVGKEVDLSECTFGNPAAPNHLLVLGNSFATAFFESVSPIADDRRYQVSLVAAYGASPVPALQASAKFVLSSEDYWERVVPGVLAQLKPGDAVLLINDLAQLTPVRPTAEAAGRRRIYIAGLEKLSNRLRARGGIGLAVLWGVPFLRDAKCNPEQAMPQWFARNARKCKYYSRKETEARFAPLAKDLKRLEDKGDIVLVSVFDDLCPGTVCSFFAPDGTFLYRDEYSHISIAGARLVSGTLTRQVEAAFPER